MPTGGEDSRNRIDRLLVRPRPVFEVAVEDLLRAPAVGLDGASAEVRAFVPVSMGAVMAAMKRESIEGSLGV